MSIAFIPIPLLLVLSIAPPPRSDSAPIEPSLMLAEVYDGEAQIADYWISEKLDGVRAYWDGTHLVTRRGHEIHAPGWFVEQLPSEPLDGELWMGRGQFDRLSGIVRRHVPDDQTWRQVRYMVFDLPGSSLTFDDRLAKLRALAKHWQPSSLQLVTHVKATTREDLQHKLQAVVAAGGEGLMLHHGASRYRGERSRDLLKFKPFFDDEARVIEHLSGRGKYEGMLGALVVETIDGLRFRVGTGFTDAQRRDPPPVGSWITYRYTGWSKRGLPRFASFLRRADPPPMP